MKIMHGTTIDSQNIIIPVLQYVPLCVGGHRHVKLAPNMGKQVPLFWHGDERQGLSEIEERFIGIKSIKIEFYILALLLESI